MGITSFEEAVHFAQSWGLAYFVILFVGVLVYALRPGAREKFHDAAQIPFKED